MTAVHRVPTAVAAPGSMDVKHELVYRPDGTTQVVSEDDVLLIKTEPLVSGPVNTVVIQPNGLVSVATSAGTVLAQPQQANGGLANGPFSGLSNNNSPASSKPRRPPGPDNDWLSSPSPSGGAPSLTPSPGPPSHAFTVISNGYSSPLSSGSYDPYSPNGKIDGKIRCSTCKKLLGYNYIFDHTS
ncbi:hypothetical protein ABEB36_008396 [Hypothenemus hampei]|uniref:Uncharacterized protein n=1 Tax=Hypothenemus hampei TaxID=57062 RepID=A0ABD1ELP8_HYPHA